MWLLSTDRAELHPFARSFDADGGYAILSHTWDGNEQSFQDVCAIGTRCRANDTNPRDDSELSPKIRDCCILAEKHGYRWVWIDSCCIDKTSSSELSEAINSMYKWYKSSEVCYAYLKDVPGDDILQSPNSAFWHSRWHTRGWTLQELIAPDSVIFLSRDWREIGTRAGLALLLQMITRLPVKLMLGVTRPAQYSACIRMSWASQRQTTRIEDEAYCLMGLFGVSMPTNYGEGKQAFIRLQYEIMQHKECDMSLFAFGEPIMLDEIIHDGITFGNNCYIDRKNPARYLLADSPRHFRHKFEYIPNRPDSEDVQQYPPPSDSRFNGPFDGGVELPRATVTSYGVEFRLPVATINGMTLAVVLCETAKRHFGLFLAKDDSAKDPTRPRYFIGCGYTRSTTGTAAYLARMCDLGDDLYKLTFYGERIKATWTTIFVVPTASDLDSESATSPHLLINCSPLSRFQLPRWLVDRFIGLQFDVDEVVYSDTLHVVSFAHRSGGRFCVRLGTCAKRRGPGQSSLWANILVAPLDHPVEFNTHDCTADHLNSEQSWATRSRPFKFGNETRTVQLSFTQPSRRLSSETFLIIHLELSGHVFEESVPKEAGIPERLALPTIPDTLASSWEPRLPWLQVGAFDNDYDSPRQTPEAPLNRLLLELSNDLRVDKEHTPPSVSNPSVPQSYSPPATHGSSSSRWASTTRLHTLLALLPRLFSKP